MTVKSDTTFYRGEINADLVRVLNAGQPNKLSNMLAGEMVPGLEACIRELRAEGLKPCRVDFIFYVQGEK